MQRQNLDSINDSLDVSTNVTPPTSIFSLPPKKSFTEELEQAFAKNMKRDTFKLKPYTLFSIESLDWQQLSIASLPNNQSEVYFTISSGNLFWLLPDIIDKFQYFVIGDISPEFCSLQKTVLDLYKNSENGEEFKMKMKEAIKLTSNQSEYFKQHLSNFPYDDQEAFLKSKKAIENVLSQNRLAIININITDSNDAKIFSNCLGRNRLSIKFFNITNTHTWVPSPLLCQFLDRLLNEDSVICFTSSVGRGSSGGYLSAGEFKQKLSQLKSDVVSGLYREVKQAQPAKKL